MAFHFETKELSLLQVQKVMEFHTTESEVEISALDIEKKAPKQYQGTATITAPKESSLVKAMHRISWDFRISVKNTFSSDFAFRLLLRLVFPFFLVGMALLLALYEFSVVGDRVFYVSGFFLAIGNSWAYATLLRFFPSIRFNQLFFIFFLGFNLLACGGYLWWLFIQKIEISTTSLYLILSVLFVSMALPAFVFKTKRQLEMKEISKQDWEAKKKEKLLGYIIRFAAVVIWGIEPLYLKYSIAGTIPSDIRVLFIAAGSAGVSIMALFLFKLLGHKEVWKPRITINIPLVLIIISQALFWYIMNISLLSTASTHFILFNNFAPIFALLVAFILWRKEIPYLQDKKNIIAIFIAFAIGGIGSSLLFYNTLKGGGGSLSGDVFAMIAMIIDVLAVTAMIRYAKFLQDHQSLFLNFYLSLSIFILFSPLLYLKRDIIMDFSLMQVLVAVFAGVIGGVGLILNSEAFRRMDGFIAFLMFNISIFVTFMVEAFILKEIQATFYLIAGGILIMGGSIVAEIINTHCEKKQIKQSE